MRERKREMGGGWVDAAREEGGGEGGGGAVRMGVEFELLHVGVGFFGGGEGVR